MRIDKMYIRKAGSLEKFEVEPKRFNLFYGPENESGKTLIVDFITDRLFRFNPRLDQSEIEGRILVTIGGKPFELTGKENLFQREYALTEETVCRVFCCRASDLDIPKKANLWRVAQEKLSDFADLNEIIENAKEISYQTSKKMLWKEPYKTRRDELKDSISKIGEILKSPAYKDIKAFRRNQQNLKSLENVRLKKTYDEGISALEKLQKKKEEIEKKCGRIGDIENTSNKLTTFEKDIQNVEERVKEIHESISMSRRAISERKDAVGDLRDEKARYADFVYEDIRGQVMQTRETERKALARSILSRNRWLSILSAFLGLEGIILGIIFNPVLLCFGFLLIVPLCTLSDDAWKARLRDRLQEDLTNLSVELAHYLDQEPSFETTSQAEIAIDEVLRCKRKTENGLMKAEIREEELERGLEEQKRELEKQEEKRENLSSGLNRFLEEIECKSGKELSERMDLKKSLLKEAKPLREKVICLLEEEDETRWMDALQNLVRRVDVEAARKFPELLELELEELEEKIDDLRKEQGELEGKVEEYKKKIYAQGVESLPQLAEKREECKLELRQLEDRFSAGRVVVDTLKEMLQSQKKLLVAVFEQGKDSISERFKRFTNGRYVQVFLQGDAVKLRTRGGRVLDSSVLSTGTRDALHLLIRTSFASLLTGERSFLFFDDPFLSFDKVRRREEGVKTLKGLMDDGWQIFFFTLDDHFCDLIKESVPPEVLMVKELEQLEV